MKKILPIVIFILLGFIFSVSGQAPWRKGEMEVRVNFETVQQGIDLGNLGYEGDIYLQQRYALLYLVPGELETVKAAGFQYEILKDDLNEFSRNFWNQRDAYHSYDEIIQVMDSLSATYPEICSKFDFGLSVEGRQLAALKISDNVNTDEDEPEIMFDGGIHGDEIGGPENLVRFAEYLCGSYGNDPDITDLIDTREIWLYIMVNPDGRVNMVRHNSHGVDLNRDWGYMWDGSGSSPGYYSQVETRALRTCELDNQFVVHTNYHSGTEFIAYPWSYRPDSCPDRPHIDQLAGVYSTSSGYPDLPYEQGYTGMYPINGSSKDMFYGVMGDIGWSIEISVNKQPPAEQIQYYYDINEPAMVEMIRYAGYGINGTVTDAGTGDPVAAMIFVDNYYPCYTDPDLGDYHKYLLPGTYTLHVRANGYTPVTQLVTVQESGSTETDFALQPAENHFAYRVVACRIPGNNFGDEARTCAALWAPDGINYSLGREGWIILDMQREIYDGPGNEIIVHEGDSDPEGFGCYASESMDGPWILVGNGTGTTAFDFSVHGITSARFIRLEDDGIGPASGDNAGYDLDAVEIVTQPDLIYLVQDCHIEDPQGNNNQRIDPGESFNMVVILRNSGSMMMENGIAHLTIDPQNISVSNPVVNIGDLDFGDSTQLVFNMNCSSFCPLGGILMTVLNITSNGGSFIQSFSLNFTAGAIIEDWETGNLSKFDWVQGGNKPWSIYFADPYQGLYSAKSGNITDNQTSSIQVTLNVIGYDDISFYHKVSSEEGSDFLKFYIDENMVDSWSGEQAWDLSSFQVVPGYHTFKWSYEKDYTGSQGTDGGWIDYIEFPSCNLDGTFKALANANPDALCEGQDSRLGVYVTGGNGNYSYAWSPAELLDDPAAQFPLAAPSATTVFTVSVGDGQDTISSSVEVEVVPVPDTPVIIQQGDSLKSSAETGNQWYDVSGPVDGATGMVFYPETENDYYDIVSTDAGCASDASNVIHFIFTGIDEMKGDQRFIVYPNPFYEAIHLIFINKDYKSITVTIQDLTGRKIATYPMILNGIRNDLTLPGKEMKKGLYLISISSPEGKILTSKKLIKF